MSYKLDRVLDLIDEIIERESGLLDRANKEEGATHRIIETAQSLVAAAKKVYWEDLWGDLSNEIQALTKAVEEYDNLFAS